MNSRPPLLDPEELLAPLPCPPSRGGERPRQSQGDPGQRSPISDTPLVHLLDTNHPRGIPGRLRLATSALRRPTNARLQDITAHLLPTKGTPTRLAAPLAIPPSRGPPSDPVSGLVRRISCARPMRVSVTTLSLF